MGEHTIKCCNVSTETKKLLLSLETDLGDATHAEALEALLEVYEDDPKVVTERQKPGF